VPAKSARGYQYLMSMVFENEVDLVDYMKHHLHHELAKWAVSARARS
jgi:Stress responsive A/B Barrel Domain